MGGGKWVIIGSPSAMAHKSAVAALHVLIKIHHPIEVLLVHDRDFNSCVCRSLVGFNIPIKILRKQKIDCVICVCERNDTTPYLEEFQREGIEVRVLRVDCP